MRQQDKPVGYSGVHRHHVLGIPVQFCFRAEVDGHAVNIEQGPAGVRLRVQECEFKAIVEFIGIRGQTIGPFDIKRWHVGFVQNLTEGAIIFRYQSPSGRGHTVHAAVAPQNLPCKDSGSVATWYDPSPYNLKRFGVPDEFAAEVPLDASHPARTSNAVRYIQMGDAPGTGALPLTVPCRQSADARAIVGQQYTIGWTDPLEPNPLAADIARLVQISGSLSFRTCLAMSSEANLANIRRTTLIRYLYYVDWYVNYNTVINAGGAAAGAAAGGVVTGEGIWNDNFQDPILAAPDANESVCVRFL